MRSLFVYRTPANDVWLRHRKSETALTHEKRSAHSFHNPEPSPSSYIEKLHRELEGKDNERP